MALQGTIQDFALPDIFQLIGIQRKTGILTLDNGEDVVTLKFLTGQVVGADTRCATLEDRLGEVLVRTGRITPAQLKEALRQQANTLQRLGHILIRQGLITEENLVEALRVQSSQIIYRLFRWEKGSYHFTPVENLDYDQTHFTPISSETILMEGVRMIDEWPIIERRIRSSSMVLRRTETGERLVGDVPSLLEKDIDFDLDLDLAFGGEEKGASRGAEREDKGPVKVSPEEHEILALVDGRRTVGELCDLSSLGEFDTCRLLSDIFTRNLIEEVRGTTTHVPQTPMARWAGSSALWLGRLVVAGLAVLALVTLDSNPLTPWQFVAREGATDQLKTFASQARLERIERALQVIYLDGGVLPPELSILARNGYLDGGDLRDPWGREYAYQVSPGGYQVQGRDAGGKPVPELALSRAFNPVQRTLLGDPGGDSGAP